MKQAIPGKKEVALSISLSLLSQAISANSVLIYNNSYGDNDLDLGALQQAAGNTVTYLNAGGTLPDLSSFSQVWDISHTTAISASDSSAYLSYVQGGGALFLMGEHSGFASRNNSVIAFIATAGGGTLTTGSGNDLQTVSSDLQTPNSISTVTYAGAGYYQSSGTGECLTIDSGNKCSALAFDVGTLANATNGSIVSVLDINFLDADSYAQFQPLVGNIVSYISGQAQAGQQAAQGGAISVLGSSIILINTPAYGAAAILDATPELLALFTGASLSGNYDISEAASETLPLLTGGSVIAADSSMIAINNIVKARIAANTGMSSGEGFLGDRHIWMKPFTSWTDQDDRKGVNGYDAETTGMVFGIEGSINDSTQLGLSFGYATANVDSGTMDAPQSLNSDIYQLIGYGSQSLDDRTEASFIVGYGQNRNDGRRNIAFTDTVANVHYDSRTLQLGAAIARSFLPRENMALVATASVDYTHIKDDPYRETGAGLLNLDVEGNTHDSLVLGIDGELSHPLGIGTLRGNLGAGYDLHNRNVVMTAAFEGAPAASFDTNGLDQSPWVFDAGMGFVHSTETGTEISLEYDLQHRQDFLNQTAAVKVRWGF